MTTKYNILVFPCGSEIGLEIHRSLKYSIHVNLFGGNSVDDHGKFVYENYIPDIPFYNDPSFLSTIKNIIEKYNIDAIYPAMDAVITKLSSIEEELSCKIIGSPLTTNQICLSKTKTYKLLKDVISVPEVFQNLDDVRRFPVFMKPEIGYGARGAKLIHNLSQGKEHLKSFPSSIILENLPGKEYTVDCFTDRNRNLLFSKARIRNRISNGISVNTSPVIDRFEEFERMASLINKKIVFKGAWFFQVKENVSGDFSLLEVASRLGGSSSLFRNQGVNFALLNIFVAFDNDVEIVLNDYNIELDRALMNRYKIDIQFKNIYVDFDDCLLLTDKINTSLISLLYQFLNDGKRIILITKHDRDINLTLKQFRLWNLFDEIIHLQKSDYKYEYIQPESAIFIDDSHAERLQVHNKLGIPVFAPDNIECLLK